MQISMSDNPTPPKRPLGGFMQFRVDNIAELKGKPDPMNLCKKMWAEAGQKEQDRYEKNYREAY